MMEKDYLLRMFGQMARAISRLIFLKDQKDYALALEFSDQLYHEILGAGSGFVNSISDEMLLNMLTSAQTLDVDKTLMIARILSTEGDIYQELGNSTESYYRNLKALNLYLAVADFEQNSQLNVITDLQHPIEDLNTKLAEFELPATTTNRLQRFLTLPSQSIQPQTDIEE